MTTEILVLNFGKCSWGKCIFCGYGRIIGTQPTPEAVDEKIDSFIQNLNDDVDEIKIFGSGSFLDDKQIPRESRKRLVQKLVDKKIRKITIESRPEYINQEKLGDFQQLEATIAFGLETAIPPLLEKIQKGLTVQDYDHAVDTVRKSGFKVRTYLVVNIPGDPDIKGNLKKSVEHALEKSDSIVIINLLPHGNTPLFQKWVDGEWSYLSKTEFEEITKPYNDDPRIGLDFETFRFKPKFPKKLMEKIDGVGEHYLTHPHFEVWQDYLTRFYTPWPGTNLLFLPCSFAKPYSTSKTHQAIIRVLKEKNVRDKVHEVMISNAGVIPRQYEDQYPFNSYNWEEKQETPGIKQRYIQVTAERIKNYLQAHKDCYNGVYCYLKRGSESYQALNLACTELGIEFRNLLKPETENSNPGLKIYSPEALADLEENTKWFAQDSTR